MTTPADVLLKQGDSKPTAPTAGLLSVYSNVDGTLRIQNSAGVETTLSPQDLSPYVLTSTLTSSLATKADLASPTFSGTPAAPNAAADTNTTQIATTAFVLAQLSTSLPLINGTASAGTATRISRRDHVHPTDTTRASAAQTGNISLYIPAAANGELARTRAPFGFTLTKIEGLCAAGSITATAQIGGTNATGGVLATTTTNGSSNITAANTYTAGQDITIIGSSASSCTGLMLMLTYTRTMAS